MIFDCDGVLVDSEVLAARINSELLKEVGIVVSPVEASALFLGLSAADITRLIFERWGVALSMEFADKKVARVWKVFETSLLPVAGMSDLLAGLTHNRCVASSSTPDRIRRSLELTGLAAHFDHLFSATEVARGKPAPDLFLHSARSLNSLPERCVVVEDSPSGVAAGVAAGMCVIGFTAGSHCPPDHANILRERGATHIVRNARELAACLEEVISCRTPGWSRPRRELAK